MRLRRGAANGEVSGHVWKESSGNADDGMRLLGMGFASSGQALMLIPFLPHPNCAGKVHGQDKPTWAAWAVEGHWCCAAEKSPCLYQCAIEGCVLL